ncbi:MAG: DUF58 domain-containing protein [Magnetococcales bacterium]|nr:DUF58 domain-containing protein [Magnetococcales bacterium]
MNPAPVPPANDTLAPTMAAGPDPVPGGWATRIDAASLLALRHSARFLPASAQQSRSLQSGSTHSLFKGSGIEYAESRPYLPGDEIRHIDWRITARSGKPHTKLFHEERDRTTLLWLDLRSSLFFASRGTFKAVAAARAATLLAWHAIGQGHRLGAAICLDNQHLALRPQHHARTVVQLIGLLSGLSAEQPPGSDNPEQQLEESLMRLRRITRPGSRLFLFSDWNPPSDRLLLHLSQLARHNELLLTMLYDPLEYTLPPPGRYPLQDGERLLLLDSHGKGQREAYRNRFQEKVQHLQNFCHTHRIGFLTCATNEDAVSKLLRLFASPAPTFAADHV